MSFSYTKHPRNRKREHLAQDNSVDHDDISLANRLRISVDTLRAWRCYSPEKLPPGFKIGRNWFFNKAATEDWLRAKYVLEGQEVDTAPALSAVKRRGKPTKAETEAAKAAGLTVPALRAKNAGGR